MHRLRLLIVLVPVFMGLVANGSGTSASAREGVGSYVLTRSEGEVTAPEDGGLYVTKASPRTGTQGGLMFYDEMTRGETSGVHYHTEADEFFYVVSGSGTITLGEKEVPIKSGDTAVVLVGDDHRITSSADDPLAVVYFLDKPGLDEQFRLNLDRNTMTLEEFNAAVRQYGTVYKSFE